MKTKMGRPKLPKGEAKNVLVAAKVSKADYEKILAAMKRAGMTESEWVRQAVLAAAEA